MQTVSVNGLRTDKARAHKFRTTERKADNSQPFGSNAPNRQNKSETLQAGGLTPTYGG
jgi:hypothetical protein